MFGIKHPIMLAGMNVAAGPDLAAAVTNAGGLGVIGGVGYTPQQLRDNIRELKEALNDKNAPFGVDLLLPLVGAPGARKTNKSYVGGDEGLSKLLDIIIEEKARLFISAVGVPPEWVVKRLHDAGIPVMNMCGAIKHAEKAIKAGVDLICGQGGVRECIWLRKPTSKLTDLPDILTASLDLRDLLLNVAVAGGRRSHGCYAHDPAHPGARRRLPEAQEPAYRRAGPGSRRWRYLPRLLSCRHAQLRTLL